MADSIRSPCIGVCSTGLGDAVCRGCKRFEFEVIHWNGYSQAQREAVLARITALLEQVLSERVRVQEPVKLRAAAKAIGRNLKHTSSDAGLVYEVLRAHGGELPSLEQIGVVGLGPWRGAAPSACKAELERDFYALCCAHFDRYFVKGAV